LATEGASPSGLTKQAGVGRADLRAAREPNNHRGMLFGVTVSEP
jgi:hypothetical protein